MEPSARIDCSITPGFAAWMEQCGGVVAVSTYQAGKVGMFGWDGRQVTLIMREFDKPLGMACESGRLAIATRHHILRLADAPSLAPHYLPEQPGRYDALYLPRVAYFTGDVNAHDLAFGDDGLWLVNTRFSCLAQLSEDHSFVPRWQPPFVTTLVPEDRCHLNGLAMRDGRPAYVTALGIGDEPGGWRASKSDGGIIIDVASGEIAARGLSMPHSPRWYRDTLWVLNSGAGELCRVDPATGKREVVCALAGYARGLAFAGDYALVGLCRIREKHIFGGLPVQSRFPELRCAIVIIDLNTGQEIGAVDFTSGCHELYDVLFIPGPRRPMILNPEREAARQAFTAPEFAYWLRPENFA
ncbi:MAG: TIGR03032 family protein [Planctomycetia bacterium]|nr:TIGR03032 family protein [Planctomycetia bacterium]